MRSLGALLLGTVLLAQEPPRKPSAQPALAPAVCADSEIAEFGLECSAEDPCPVYLEIAGLASAGGRLFATGNFHTSTATLWSLLAVSDDDGKTWREPASRIRGAALDLIQFSGTDTGWAAGHIAGELPRDPFFLRTSDNGDSWRRIPVFEDSSYGVVENFVFDSKSHGLLVINRRGARNQRYQKMETQSGADSWMLREVSPSAIALPRTRAADYRIRVDSAARLQRIERRTEKAWEPLSAFPVSGGACKPAPRPEPPPQN
ncbi:MAG: hypothetical protein HY821_21185 [Acidobacteria bacterium]|nr:hypothetical protein [Acidobacteriota bacterium]